MKSKTKMMFGFITLGLAGFIFYGIWAVYADQPQPQNKNTVQTYGRVQEGSDPVPISTLLSGENEEHVTIEGKVIDMGPTMGCWLVIDDGTGKILVQTNPMTYVHQEVKGNTLRATGSLAIMNGGMGFSGETLALITPGITVKEDD
jgi:hypothetical protein